MRKDCHFGKGFDAEKCTPNLPAKRTFLPHDWNIVLVAGNSISEIALYNPATEPSKRKTLKHQLSYNNKLISGCAKVP